MSQHKVFPLSRLIFPLSANLQLLYLENNRFFRRLPTSDTYVRKTYQILGVNPPLMHSFLNYILHETSVKCNYILCFFAKNIHTIYGCHKIFFGLYFPSFHSSAFYAKNLRHWDSSIFPSQNRPFSLLFCFYKYTKTTIYSLTKKPTHTLQWINLHSLPFLNRNQLRFHCVKIPPDVSTIYACIPLRKPVPCRYKSFHYVVASDISYQLTSIRMLRPFAVATPFHTNYLLYQSSLTTSAPSLYPIQPSLPILHYLSNSPFYASYNHR